MKYFFLFFIILYQECVAQTDVAQKLLIRGEYGYYCKNKKDNSVLLTRLNLDSDKVDSMYMLSNPTGMFNEHPIVWELLDSMIFQLRLVNDGGGMPYPELRAFKNNKIEKYVNENQAYEYLLSQETLKDNEIGPLYSYIRRIYYKEDTLKGPIFFDIIQKSDSLFLYIYIHDKKMIEVWNFNRYPLIVKKLDVSNASQIIKKKAWELRKKIPAEMLSPFQLVDISGKVYAIEASGNVWNLSGVNARKSLTIPSAAKRGTLVVDKDVKTVRFFKNTEFNVFDKKIKSYIEKSSTDIKIK